MSKGNMLLGHARGKVGSLVFSRNNGKQIVRAKAEVVANPQTDAQMIQRIFLNTIAQAYSNMSAIVDHSFEGVKKGQPSMSFFMQKNLKNLRERVSAQLAAGASREEIFSFTPIGTAILVPNNYLISKGTLPKVAVLDDNADASMKVTLSANTYAAMLADYGLERGDQLTFMAITGNSADDAAVSFCRVILDPRNADGTAADLSSALVADGAINLPSERNEGTFVTLTYADGHLSFGFGSTYMLASAVIVSRKANDGTWKRSTAYMTANESSAEVVYNLEYCLQMLKEGGISTMSNRYLNNAGTGSISSGTAPTEMVNVTATVGAGGGGTVSGGGSVPAGRPVTLTATPNEGKIVDNWRIDDEIVQQGGNTYTFTPTEDTDVVVIIGDPLPNGNSGDELPGGGGASDNG